MPNLLVTITSGAAIGASLGLGYGLYKRMHANVPALNPNEFKSFKVFKNEPVNHNTHLIRLSLPENTTTLGLPVASCIVARFQDENAKTVIRPYTPVSTEAETQANGYFDLVIKQYVNGPMSTHMCNLKPGDSIELKGPIPKIDMKQNTKSHIGMIAGGTGITPMLQVVSSLLADAKDKRSISLIFANVEERDVLLRDQLELLVKQHPERFKVFYTLDRPPSGWMHGKGHVSEDMIRARLPSPGPDTLIMVCGPDPMVKFIAGAKNPDRSQGPLAGLLKNMGYNEEQVFKF